MKSTSVRLLPAEERRAKKAARKEGISYSEFGRRAILERVGQAAR